ncbi:hypothetical protein BJV74DRAFT_798886 [Russula compacta]|nr:hypothetical protein BJV74DRAFT_798886 [Russula compacta]
MVFQKCSRTTWVTEAITARISTFCALGAAVVYLRGSRQAPVSSKDRSNVSISFRCVKSPCGRRFQATDLTDGSSLVRCGSRLSYDLPQLSYESLGSASITPRLSSPSCRTWDWGTPITGVHR